MAINRRQDVVALFGSAPSVSLPLPSNVVAGNVIAVSYMHNYLGCAPTITDSQGNTYTGRYVHATSGAVGRLYVATAVAGANGACTITLSMPCATSYMAHAAELEGADTTSPLDNANQHISHDEPAPGPINGPSATATGAGGYAVAFYLQGAGTPQLTPGAGWSNRNPDPGEAYTSGWLCQDAHLSAAGAVVPTMTTSFGTSNMVCTNAVFKAAADPGIAATASANIDVTTSAVGVLPIEATASAELSITATAVGVNAIHAQAVASFALTAGAVGVNRIEATSAASVAITAQATGVLPIDGAASAAIAFTAAATGSGAYTGQASASLAFTAQAIGVNRIDGAGVSTLTITAAAVGVLSTQANANAPFTLTAQAIGVNAIVASATALFNLSVQASALPTDAGCPRLFVTPRATARLTVRPSFAPTLSLRHRCDA